MGEVSTIGLDVAKPVFQMHWVHAGHPRAEELPSLSTCGGATRATDRDFDHSRTNYSVEPNYSVPRFDFMTVWEIGLVLGLVIAGGAFSLLFLGATFILWESNKMTKPGDDDRGFYRSLPMLARRPITNQITGTIALILLPRASTVKAAIMRQVLSSCSIPKG